MFSIPGDLPHVTAFNLLGDGLQAHADVRLAESGH